MLRIYNYMSIGLAITGLAALGVYMAAVTNDPSGAAAKIGNAFLTPFGYAMFVSPLKWLFILAPLVMVFVISAGINRLAPATAQMLLWVCAARLGVALSSSGPLPARTPTGQRLYSTAAPPGGGGLCGDGPQSPGPGWFSFLFIGLSAFLFPRLGNRSRARVMPPRS